MHILEVNKIRGYMKKFEGQNLLELTAAFQTEENCKEYLSKIKWRSGYECRRCGHKGSQKRTNLSRTCNKCSHTESPTSGTLFHKVKFGIRKAFYICFEMATTTKSLSATQTAARYGITEKTARLFMHKVRKAMQSSQKHPIDGDVQVDEFVLGGKEEGVIGRSYDSKKKKAVCALQLTEEGEVKRIYAQRINDFSAKELKGIFEKHIDPSAAIITDKWKSYRPLSQHYNITQIESTKGPNFPALHTMIHQVKSWIRTTYSWVSHFHINRYFDEFCYRINRSQSKKSIFHNLINRMIQADKIYQSQLVCT